jgi:hypothetical protein
MRLVFVVLTLVMLLLISCSPQTISPTQVCQTDQDCVPAQCCHATSAVNKDNAPNCSGKLCTLNCEPNTLDCAQGSVLCDQGQCVVKLNDQ